MYYNTIFTNNYTFTCRVDQSCTQRNKNTFKFLHIKVAHAIIKSNFKLLYDSTTSHSGTEILCLCRSYPSQLKSLDLQILIQCNYFTSSLKFNITTCECIK